MATTTSATVEHEHGHPSIVLATLALASVMSVMNLFIVNVALHTIGSHLHSSLSDVAWVLNAYALFFGALLVPAGRFSDKIGRKTVFMLGLAIFTIASLACAVSPDLWVLIAFRCVQAIGAAMLIPSSLGLVLTTMPPARVESGESKEDWLELGRDLTARGLGAPRLVVADGAPGLISAVQELWPRADRQHCCVHRLRNLVSKLPKAEHDRVRFNYWSALTEPVKSIG